MKKFNTLKFTFKLLSNKIGDNNKNFRSSPTLFENNFKILDITDENMRHIMSLEDYTNEVDRLKKRINDVSPFDNKKITQLYLQLNGPDSFKYKGPYIGSRYDKLIISTPFFILSNVIFLTEAHEPIIVKFFEIFGLLSIFPNVLIMAVYPLSWGLQAFAIYSAIKFTYPIHLHNEVVRLSNKYKKE
jgi:hypothetical protein